MVKRRYGGGVGASSNLTQPPMHHFQPFAGLGQRFSNPRATDIWGRILVCLGDDLCILGYVQHPASTHWVSVPSPISGETARNVPRHWQCP